MVVPDETIVVNISTLIQLSVAPVFLIAGVAGLLNVLIGRLARIIDKLEAIDRHTVIERSKDPDFQEDTSTVKRRKFLVKRMQNINSSIFFGAATGLMVALVILIIFSSALFDFNSKFFIAGFFITAMLFLVVSLILFLREIHFTTSFIEGKRKGVI
ncbi:MAG: DUF2721 domain-containing protein [Campylobacterales bacterium]|nr:DUF2721 domain-containing protein [Campylobacterales bacterium]